MRDGIDIKLNELGYEAYSVKKLVENGQRLHSDYSIMKYAESNNMILVTEDIDNIEGCKENNMGYVEFGQDQTFEYLITELEKIKHRKVDSTIQF